MRLAWFTPLPPTASGVARYNLELLASLASGHAIDIVVDHEPDRFVRPPGYDIFTAHDFVWKHFQHPYDLIVYQLGNAPCHDYMWAYMVRYPGLVVLHDGQLHHARGRLLLFQQREEDYRREFHYNDPTAGADIAELGIAGLLGSLTYLWPMRRVIVESARRIVVHNGWLADQIRAESPRARVTVVDMGVPAPDASPDARSTIRARHAIPADAIVFAALGNVTPEKRIPQAIQAIAALRPTIPNVHLLLVGSAVEHYDAAAEAAALGVDDCVTIAGYVPHEELGAYLAAADSCLCMRWPSSRETSAAWLRCLAAGRATIITDLAHTVDIPALDPRSWELLHAHTIADVPQPVNSESSIEPACISVDILNENHSLRLAMRRLATDLPFRHRLERNARELWRQRFTLDGMIAAYREVIATALTDPVPDAEFRAQLPLHFVTDGTEGAVRRLREMNVPESRIAGLWGDAGSRLA